MSPHLFFLFFSLFCASFVYSFNQSAPLTYLELQSASKLKDILGPPPNGDSHLEGSGVIFRRDKGQAYVVCDNLYNEVLDISSSIEDSSYIKLHRVHSIESYEGITFDNNTKTFYLVTEDIHLIGFYRYKARILSFTESFQLLSRGNVDYIFDNEYKGIEGLASVTRNGQHYLLGLCEGNDCSNGDKGSTPGKGTILVLKSNDRGTWSVEDKLYLPSELPFEDYSGIDVYNNQYITVVSQTSCLFWVGELDPNSWSIIGGSNAGYLFGFPKNAFGRNQFCTVEGVSFVNSTQVVVTTDQTSDPECSFYAESICTFNIPW